MATPAQQALHRHQASLTRYLEDLNKDGSSSFAIIFVETHANEKDVARIREAARICDRVVVASMALSGPAQATAQLLKLGVDAVYVPEKETRLCEVTMNVPEIDATFVLQTILAVLPNLILADPEDVHMLRCLRNLQQTFGDLFALRIL